MTKSQVDNKVIGFDMDGVVFDHTENKIRAAKKFGILLKKKQTPSILVKEFFSPSDYEKFKKYFYDDIAKTYKPNLMPGVKEVLELVKKRQIQFYLISRQKYPQKAIGILSFYGLWPKYFNRKNTFFVLEPEDKEIKANALGITHYIDDEQKVLDVLHSVPNKILFDPLGIFKNPSPFGKVRDKNSGYARVKSWKEVAKLI
ncbi:MAG: hypothetical protein HYT64_01140 [Candidatus Yanofskybacteria bacterium]|nr:hypothetical protein [Candidatus Yanofskybacteria bacterium]